MPVMIKKALIIAMTLLACTLANPEPNKVIFVNGSQIYIKIFLFFFPVGKKYDTYFIHHDDTLTTEIEVTRNNIINEPINEKDRVALFATDLNFSIKEIPIGQTGEFTLPLSIRCNKKITKKNVTFTIVTVENIMVIKGAADVKLGEITDNPYYKNRYKWKYPFYFDIRLQLSDDMLNSKAQ